MFHRRLLLFNASGVKAACACVIFAVWGALRLAPDAFVVPVFCRVPAGLAAGYYNAPLQTPEMVFTVRGADFEVARPCGATDFFLMVAGLFAYLCLKRRSLWLGFAALPAAWLVTTFANTLRVILLVPGTTMIYHFLPERFHVAGHQAVGTFVFLTLFILLWEGVRYATLNTPR